MAAIPGEPLKPKPPELTLGDGRKFKLKGGGVEALKEPLGTEERGAAEPPRDDVRQARDPNHAF